MRGARTFCSGVTVEYGRNFFPDLQHDYLAKIVNAASAEGASEKICDF